MSKHISRRRRWTQEDPRRYSSALGSVVYDQNAWFGLLDYKTLEPQAGAKPTWTAYHRRLGPCKRPRNAMIALEAEATILRNRHGANVLFGDQLWAETVAHHSSTDRR